jgi:nucleotide-binding universal stress UspA family protein
MNNIMLAVDGSECSLKAAHFLANLAQWYKEPPQIFIIHVDEMGTAAEGARRRLGNETVENYFNERAKIALQPAEMLFQEKGVPYRTIYAGGDVASQIRAHADECKADMIVMGSRGHGAVAGLLMGSVANKVLATTSLPVTIIR